MPSEAALETAHRHASKAEEYYEEGRWMQAVESFEAASEAYVSAILDTTDTNLVQSLRRFAQSHSHRAHELRMRMKLHGMQARLSVGESGASAVTLGQPSQGGCSASGAAAAAQSAARASHGTSVSAPAATHAAAAPAAAAESFIVSGAFARLSSQLISTLEELRFGAEELTKGLAAVVSAASQPAGGAAASIVSGSKPLIDSFCVVNPHRAAVSAPGTGSGSLGGSGSGSGVVHAASHPLQHSVISARGVGSGEGRGSPFDPSMGRRPAQSSPLAAPAAAGSTAAVSASGTANSDEDELRAALAQKENELRALARENAALRKAAADIGSTFAKAQQRCTDQQRLARKALIALREVHATPRPELDEGAAKEIADLRRQLEGAHAARRQQAMLVRKYEQRWAQLKASARRKVQAQQQVDQQGP